MALHGTEHTEEEVPLRQLPRELFLTWKVLAQHRVRHGVVIEVLDGDLLVERNLKADDLVLLEVQLPLREDVSHEAYLGGFHRREEHVDYKREWSDGRHLPC